MSKGIYQSIDIPFAHMEGVQISLPAVDVVIGNFKQGQFVRDAILSVAQQNYPHYQCVVVDDASHDGSAEVIREVLRELDNERFRFIEHKENSGQMATMLTGLEGGHAPFVAFLDADDVWMPSFLETHVACHLNSQINAAISGVNLAVINANGTIIAGADPGFSMHGPIRNQASVVPLTINSLRRQLAQGERKVKVMFVRNDYQRWIWPPTSGLVFRRDALEIARPANANNFKKNADMYWSRICHVIGGSILMQDVHGYYRLHESNMFSRRMVFGDGYVNGIEPPSVSEATRRTIFNKLVSDKTFASILTGHHFIGTALGLAKTSSDLRELLKAPHLDKKTKRGLRRKLRKGAANALWKAIVNFTIR